jgi:hypothetical protein
MHCLKASLSAWGERRAAASPANSGQTTPASRPRPRQPTDASSSGNAATPTAEPGKNWFMCGALRARPLLDELCNLSKPEFTERMNSTQFINGSNTHQAWPNISERRWTRFGGI